MREWTGGFNRNEKQAFVVPLDLTQSNLSLPRDSRGGQSCTKGHRHGCRSCELLGYYSGTDPLTLSFLTLA